MSSQTHNTHSRPLPPPRSERAARGSYGIRPPRSDRAARRPDGIRVIRVLLVDDHPPVRYGMRRLIDEQPGLATIAEAGGAAEATGELGPWVDVAVIDYHLGGPDGLWLTRQIKQRSSPPPVLIYSAFADPVLTVTSIVAGADGLLGKAALADELTIAIRRLFRGRKHFPPPPQSVTAALRAELAPRDHAIFSMLMHGVATTEISSRLGISRGELEMRREAMLGAIASGAERTGLRGLARAPLDYQRARRRLRYPAAG